MIPALIVTVVLIAVAIKVAAMTVEAYRIMEAEERRQLHQAFMINFGGGPCAPMFLDNNKYQHRSLL